MKSNNYSVYKAYRRVGWAVKRQGSSRAYRVFLRQEKAVALAKKLASKSGGGVIVHDRWGQVQHFIDRNQINSNI